MNTEKTRTELGSKALLASMTPEERYYANHFLSACDEGVGFCVPRKMRYRLRELGLMRWVGGRWFDVTDKLRDMEPLLTAMCPDFDQDANAGSHRQEEAGQ